MDNIKFWHSPVFSGILGGLLGSLLTVSATYLITFKKIEEPKLFLEKKKVYIEANKQVLSLMPNVETKCTAKSMNNLTLRVACHSKNSGQYNVKVRINDKVLLSNANDITERKYGGGFRISFPDDQKGYNLAPNSEGDLWFYINFDQKKYPHGLEFSNVLVLVDLNYLTSELAQKLIIQQFPETKDMVLETVNKKFQIFIPITKNSVDF